MIKQIQIIFLSILAMAFGCQATATYSQQRKPEAERHQDLVKYFKSKDATFVELSSDGALTSVYSHSKFTDEDIKRLKNCAELESLSLLGAPVTDQAVINLEKLPKLRKLILNRSSITDRGVLVIAQMTQLKELDLGWTRITDASVDRLANLKGLNSLQIHETLITPNGVERLKAALPRTEIGR